MDLSLDTYLRLAIWQVLANAALTWLIVKYFGKTVVITPTTEDRLYACEKCGAGCTFEAMEQCSDQQACPAAEGLKAGTIVDRRPTDLDPSFPSEFSVAPWVTDATEVLIKLGHKRREAEQLVKVAVVKRGAKTVNDVLRAAYDRR